MGVATNSKECELFLQKAADVSPKHPVVVSKFFEDTKEIEVDAPRLEAIAANLSLGDSELETDGPPPSDARVVDLSEVDRYLAGLKS